MPRSKRITWPEVERVALAYPGVVARSSYGTPGLYVGKQFMARLREPGVLVLKPVEDDEQRFLMETQPQAFFLTDHYRGYPTILVRLSKVGPAQLAGLLDQSWRRLATRKLLAELDSRPSTRSRSNRPAKVTSTRRPTARTDN